MSTRSIIMLVRFASFILFAVITSSAADDIFAAHNIYDVRKFALSLLITLFYIMNKFPGESP